MRPRHKAAENGLLHPDRIRNPVPASMRPRHKAAENVGLAAAQLLVLLGFNEAAA